MTFLGGSEYRTDGSSHLVTSRVSGETVQVDVRRRVVDATYLSPTIPATTRPPFGVADDVPVVAINELARLAAAPERFVIVGSGKTATDGIVWLLTNGVQPDRIVWVRPREPWMLDRAVVQPDPVVALGLAADTMAAAADAESLDDLFLRLEAAGVMLRIDTDVIPTMAKTPTLGAWELDLLRTVENVVRLGHIRHVTRHEIVLDDGSVPTGTGLADRALRRVGTAVPAAGPHLGSRTGSGSRPSGPASRASARPWPATWRRPATTTASATGCVRPTRSPTPRPTGRGCRSAGRSLPAPTAPSRTSPPGPTAAL